MCIRENPLLRIREGRCCTVVCLILLASVAFLGLQVIYRKILLYKDMSCYSDMFCYEQYRNAMYLWYLCIYIFTTDEDYSAV